ncbi:MAG TPA: TonB-dependent receptor plug domain-containing protein [Bacteroidia bacterium]|nr:TonB-dependent receptor plug domain-containing protein [Bacteroidia bacterium]
MKKSYKLLLFFFLVSGYISYAQEPVNPVAVTDSTKKDSLNYYDMTIEQLLSLKAHGVPSELEKLINSLISVASKKPLNVRESPSIVTLVTAEEIKNSGARDLIDVLRLVPGVDFGVDVQGVVGIGMRGNWAHEGKVLILLDGQEMNEILFATTQFGNHFPIDQIKKIEIIRGPGSAIYGGYAEYGVINIITKQGGDINGVSVSGIYGQTEKDFMRRNINLSAGKKIGDFEWSVSGMMGQGQRSDQNYTDIYGSSYTMIGNSALNPAYANVGASYKGLSFRAIGDFYKTTTQDGYDAIYPKPYAQNFNSTYFELKYLWKVSKKLTITPKLNYKNQSPWKTPQGDSIDQTYLKTATRSTANITASYNPTRKINVVFGSEYYKDMAVDHLAGDTFYNGKQTVSFYNYAFFAQGLLKTRFVNIILGARYDKHNVYGDAFVPRVGLTKKYNKFHFKALYSNSFRAPAIENINLSGANGIHPEKTQVLELELGYQLTHNSIFTINFFDITTKNPIIYYSIGAGTDAYTNQGNTGTRGFEAEYKVKDTWGYIAINYSYYTAAGKDKSAAYNVVQDPSMMLGFASSKVNLNASIKLTENLSINPSGTFYGPRWGYNSVDTGGYAQLSKFNSVFLFNLFLKYNTPVKGLSIGFGVYDIFNEKFVFIQPYAQPGSLTNLPHAPLPGPPREFIFRLSYDLNFKAKTTK